MLLRHLILVARLREIHARLIEFLARKRTLLKQVLPAVEDFLLSVKHLLGGLQFKLRLLHFRRQLGAGADFIRGLSLIVCALCVLRRGGKVLMFKHSKQLPLVHAASALNKKGFYRSTDLRNNR